MADGRRARDDAPALADATSLSLPDADPIANGLRRAPRRRAALRGSRAARTSRSRRALFQLSQRFPQPMRRLFRAGAQRQLPRRLRRRHALQAALRPVGPAPVRRARRRPVQGAVQPATPSVVTDRDRHASPSAASACSPARELEADVVVTATGLNLLRVRRHRVHRRRRARSSCPTHDRLQGHDAQRRAELRLRDRLHEHLVDAEGRPRLRVRLPAARPHGRARATRARCPSATRRSPERPFLDFSPGYVLRALDQLPKQGAERPWRLSMSYIIDVVRDPPRAGRRRRAAVHLVTGSGGIFR